MLLMAHTGITLGAAYLLERAVAKTQPQEPHIVDDKASTLKVDYRFILFGALLPDLIDKPLGLILSGNGRTFAHTVLFLLLIMVLAIVISRTRGKLRGFYIAFGVIVHFILDSMWLEPVTLFWPFFGMAFPVYPEIGLSAWIVKWLTNLSADPLVYVPEMLGSIIVMLFTVKTVIAKKVKAFLLTGVL